MKERIDNVEFIKIKNLCSVKDNVERMRRHKQTGKKLQKKCLIKNCYPEYSENLEI